MKNFTKIFLASAIILLGTASLSFAMDLATAKQEGLIGEQENGLVGLIDPNSPDAIQILVKQTNQGRLKVYNETAANQRIPASQVQAIAAQKLISMTPAGQYIQRNGRWVQK